MASKSRWAAPDPEEEAFAARKRQEKEAKKRAKEARQRAAEAQQREAAEKKEATASADAKRAGSDAATDDGDEAKRAAKRQRLSHEPAESAVEKKQAEIPEPPTLLRFPTPEWRPCRHVDNFENLNRIEEGSYGFVSRAKDKNTGEIVALKKLKMDNPGDGFPITGLREIQTLMESKHENILHLREVVMGDTLDE
ncbi:hypothetical protein KEM55_000457 [Ascosphaera atra]|nr:hypothetical protein KEM55_000457 [Ascosphaera atra]